MSINRVHEIKVSLAMNSEEIKRLQSSPEAAFVWTQNEIRELKAENRELRKELRELGGK